MTLLCGQQTAAITKEWRPIVTISIISIWTVGGSGGGGGGRSGGFFFTSEEYWEG